MLAKKPNKKLSGKPCDNGDDWLDVGGKKEEEIKDSFLTE